MSNSFIKLPDPDKPRKKKPLPTCPDCRKPLIIYKAWGSCEECHRGISLPIGRVKSTGSQNGKEVHLASSIIRELSQDTDWDDTQEDFEEELKDRDFLIIDWIDYDT